MTNVLLIVPADCDCRTALREAIAEAKNGPGRRLYIAAVMDPQICERLSESLSETGLVGERVSDSVCSTLMRDYEQRARVLADELSAAARQEQVDALGLAEQGEPSEVCGRLVRAHEIGTAILVAERRSWLTRLLSGGTLRMPALPGCEVRVVEED